MKKKVLLSLLIIVTLFTITGCGTSKNNHQGNGKSYQVNGVDIKLDKDDGRDNIQYKTSSSFTSNYTVSGTSYTLYKDENKDKYDLLY